jgi:hypothetical protein
MERRKMIRMEMKQTILQRYFIDSWRINKLDFMGTGQNIVAHGNPSFMMQ